MKIGLFIPCYINAVYPEVGVASYKLLRHLGLEVDYPLDQTCCGLPLEMMGQRKTSVDVAKQNEPNNASLYYVEGDIHNKLGHKEEAKAAYLKSNEINPDYEFGLIGLGIMYYNEALELQEKASNEFDNAKYEAIIVEFEAALKNAIDPFEKAFNISKDNEIKVSIAEYLKNIYYRFRDQDPKYMEGYQKYSSIVENGL